MKLKAKRKVNSSAIKELKSIYKRISEREWE